MIWDIGLSKNYQQLIQTLIISLRSKIQLILCRKMLKATIIRIISLEKMGLTQMVLMYSNNSRQIVNLFVFFNTF